MLRLFFLVIIRLLIVAIAVTAVLAIVRGIARALSGPAQGSSAKPSGHPQTDIPPKPQEEYKDVRDATFEELPDAKNGNPDKERE